MAKVKIQGNASGTGVLTVTAPNTSTDRTITLPDSTGELLSTAGGTMTGDLTIGTVGSVTSSGSDLKISGTDDIFFNVAGASDNILQLYGNNTSNVNTQTKVASPFYPFADNSYDLGNSSERWKDLYLSGGLKVGGTGSANTLDDYEEGTWTPFIHSSNSNRSGTWSNTVGIYTKIGNIVHLYFGITGSAMYFTSERGYQYITGIPFNAANPTYYNTYSGTWSGDGVNRSSAGHLYLNGSGLYMHSANSNPDAVGVNGIGCYIAYRTNS